MNVIVDKTLHLIFKIIDIKAILHNILCVIMASIYWYRNEKLILTLQSTFF